MQWHACSKETIMEARRQAEVETDALIRYSGVVVAAAIGGDNGTHSDTLTL
jgi:hypothetical protein